MPMPLEPESPTPRAGAVITACRIGPILCDTILSLLHQEGAVADPLILVIDGCSQTRTTAAIVSRFLRAHPQIHSIWVENGGVSRARNIGVRAALDMAPDLDAIFLLDGDDLVPPNALASSLAVLGAARKEADDTRPGWVYFDQAQFGAQYAALRYPDTMSPPRWLGSNLSQPSCLYAAEMFRAGVFWDEDMRQGIEDWEFWYAAIDAGFFGVFNPETSLRYRRLAGNRSSLNRAKDHLTKRYMRTKHKPLLAPSRLLAWEARDHPRWAFYNRDADTWRLASDPDTTAGIATWDQAEAAFAMRAAQYAPRAVMFSPYFPDIAAILTPAADTHLRAAGLLHDTLCRAEELLADAPLAILSGPDEKGVGLESHPGPISDADLSLAEGVFLSTTALARRSGVVTREPEAERPVDVAAPGVLHSMIARLWRERPVAPPRPVVAERPTPRAAAAVVLEMQERLVAARTSLGSRDFLHEENKFCGADKANHAALTRELIGSWPLLPRLKHGERRDLALILPPAPCDGARWFLDNVLGHEASAYRLHLVSPGHEPLPAGYLGLSRETCRLTLGLDLSDPPPGLTYVDVPLFEKCAPEGQARAVGRLAVMDRVVNFCGPAVAGPLMALRKLGVETALCTPAEFDPTPAHDLRDAATIAAGNLLGVHSHAAAYDHILCQDDRQARRLAATGVAVARIDVGGRKWAHFGKEESTADPALAQRSA